MARKILITIAIILLASAVNAETIKPTGGAGFNRLDIRDHVSPEQRARIIQNIEANRNLLREQGLLPEPVAAQGGLPAHPLFDWPLAGTSSDPGYFGISNFLDQDPAFPNQLEDYNCGLRTYDTDTGYNHKGLDVYSWPFGWLKMDLDEVQIIAAEPGAIIGKDDGNFDRNCSFTGNWNAVYIQHADGSVAWYGHLKKNSLTSKSIGQSVAAGEFLGIMGSSGQSTGPHLHFEVYDSSDKLVDPSQGVCNSLNADSWWASQRPYYESSIIKVATHDAPPVFDNGCGVTETPNFQQNFAAGQLVYFAVYLRDQLADQLLDLKIYQPDGTIWTLWTFSMETPDHYSSSWWYWTATLPANPQAGAWRWHLGFEGQQAETTFFVGAEGVFADGFEE